MANSTEAAQAFGLSEQQCAFIRDQMRGSTRAVSLKLRSIDADASLSVKERQTQLAKAVKESNERNGAFLREVLLPEQLEKLKIAVVAISSVNEGIYAFFQSTKVCKQLQISVPSLQRTRVLERALELDSLAANEKAEIRTRQLGSLAQAELYETQRERLDYLLKLRTSRGSDEFPAPFNYELRSLALTVEFPRALEFTEQQKKELNKRVDESSSSSDFRFASLLSNEQYSFLKDKFFETLLIGSRLQDLVVKKSLMEYLEIEVRSIQQAKLRIEARKLDLAFRKQEIDLRIRQLREITAAELTEEQQRLLVPITSALQRFLQR